MMGYLVRIFASLLVGQATMWYLSRRTRDENVVGAILWSRVMVGTNMVVSQKYYWDVSHLLNVYFYVIMA